MDNEKGNNIDDIIKLLKNTVDKTEEHTVETESESVGGEINADLLKEMLREKYSSDDVADDADETDKDDYSIDESFMNEIEADDAVDAVEKDAEDDAQEIIEKTVEAVEEDTVETDFEAENDTETEIINIAIPWVESIAKSAAETEATEENKENEVETEEDFFSDEDYEESESESESGGFVMFAEETDETDEETDEFDDAEDFDDAEELEDTEKFEDEEDYDLPWYDDSEIIERANEQMISEQTPEAEHESESESEPELLDTIERIGVDNDEVVEEESFSETSYVSADYESTEEVIVPSKSEKLNDYGEDSFYRTMVEAKEEREIRFGYAYGYQNVDNTAQSEPVSEGEEEIGSENTDDVKETVEESTIEYRVAEEKEEISEDFYGLGEQDTDEEEDVEFDNYETDELDYEQEDDDTNKIVNVFEKSIYLKVLRWVLVSVLTIGIVILELLPIIGIAPDGILDHTAYPISYILIDTQLLIFIGALFYDRIIDGFVRMFDRRTNFWSVLSVTLAVTLIYGMISMLSANEAMPNLYNLVSALYILVMHFIECIDERRRFRSVKLLSESKNVFTLKQSQGKNSCAEKMYLGGVNPDTTILEFAQIKETTDEDQYDNAFSQEEIGNVRNISFFSNLVVSSVTPALIFSVCMAVISIVLERGLSVSLNAFAFSFVLVAPLMALVAYYFPIFVIHARLIGRGCVITGYEGASQIGDCNAMVFSDRHLFKDCDAKEAGIKLYCEGAKIRELFTCLASVYEKLGGPMKDTFAAALGSEKHKVNMIRITRNGFEAIVDQRMVLVVGSSDYLARYGIVTDKADKKDRRVLYAALNSTLSAKFHLSYRTQPILEALTIMLDKYSIRTVVETYDPIISGKYVAMSRENGEGASAISVIHKNVNDYNAPPASKVQIGKTGAFASESRLKLVELAIFCKRLLGIRRVNTVILIGSYVFSVLLGIIFTFSGAIEYVNLLWVLLYQLILALIYGISAIKYLPLSFDQEQNRRARAEEKNKTEEDIEKDQDE